MSTQAKVIVPKKKKHRFSLMSTIIVILVVIFAILVLLPVLNVFSAAVSSLGYVMTGAVTFWPKGFQLDTVRYVLGRSEFQSAIQVTLTVTLAGTALAMFLTVTAAYPLSKPHLKGRKVFLYMYVIVMLFGAGMVPNYLLYRSLNLTNTIWALIFSGAFSVYNMFIVKNYMESLPEAVEESAMLDGAGNITILTRIVLPMSLPVLATMTLFYAVGYWNSYFAGVMYITKPSLKPLQQYLLDLVNATSNSTDNQMMNSSNQDLAEQIANMGGRGMQAATITLSMLPIMCVYPFLQKYFVKGITIGSVKG